IMVLFSRSILKDKPGATIISEVKSSNKLYDDIAAKGGKPVMWKTGHSLIKSKMKETKAALAGEMSGHIFFADRYFGYDDAIYAALRVYEIASKNNAPFPTRSPIFLRRFRRPKSASIARKKRSSSSSTKPNAAWPASTRSTTSTASAWTSATAGAWCAPRT